MLIGLQEQRGCIVKKQPSLVRVAVATLCQPGTPHIVTLTIAVSFCPHSQRRDASSSTGPQFKPTSVTSSPPSLVEAEGRHRGNGVACAAHEGDGEDGEWAAFGDEWRRERAHLVERAGGSGREWSGGSGARHRARARRHNGTGGDADREVEMAELGIASMDNGVTAGASSGVHYRAVLVDFGSCCEARRTVRDFHTMMVVKEQAEAHSTAPYRAPELFEPPMPGSVDERVDVWSLGATAYFAMFGEGPFDYALREGGGSIALAVLSGRMRWPEARKGGMLGVCGGVRGYAVMWGRVVQEAAALFVTMGCSCSCLPPSLAALLSYPLRLPPSLSIHGQAIHLY